MRQKRAGDKASRKAREKGEEIKGEWDKIKKWKNRGREKTEKVIKD